MLSTMASGEACIALLSAILVFLLAPSARSCYRKSAVKLFTVLLASFACCCISADLPAPKLGLELKLPVVRGRRPVSVSLGDRTVRITRLAARPHVFRVDGMLNKTERKSIIDLAKKEESIDSSKMNEKSWRFSTQFWVRKDPRGAHPLVISLSKRVAKLFSVSEDAVQAGHPLQVVWYRQGEYYFPHVDSKHFDERLREPQLADYKKYNVWGGYPYSLRAATLFCILKEPVRGGNTTFPLIMDMNGEGPPYPNRKLMDYMGNAHSMWVSKLPGRCAGEGLGALAVAPKAGSCILFYNHLLPDEGGRIGELDGRSLHAGCEVAEGSKVAMNWWLEVQPPFSDIGGEDDSEL